MAFCDHCEGQRFDRAQVLRALRALRRNRGRNRRPDAGDRALALAIGTVRALDIPHLEPPETVDGEVIH